ncbi:MULTISPECIES: ScpA family protein [unclassified Rothia (in: high G+C Gram-positive bacteria)]|uniref:segregation and condensation protein A n=1 Tax=unclassified Rothia (in: high G+C Gram-positive bacteria) TaxID=2689056 RepID=UPI00195E3957|nr:MULTISPECIES: ScpA family protein [unclassified Rothia (in: high G+C Gram-positive bacteria)]MBM7050814.1 segregation/condensation protein A [Rothia sp. ZJ1223]QRZ60989.1 segregation/condensation protein A [Rothia sp. ZJ932]
MSAHLDAAVMAPQATGESGVEFTLHLGNFEGPFDLLLHLISRRKLDVTDVALSQVTDEFLTFIQPLYTTVSTQALDIASQFTVTAATLLDIKVARLLPSKEPETASEFAALEARDLLFARLLQYRAYKEVADILDQRMGAEAERFARDVVLEERFARALPELVFDITPQEFASVAHRALASHDPLAELAESQPVVDTEHLREPLTTIAREEENIVRALENQQSLPFEELAKESSELEIAVVRFLALLELYRNRVVELDQDKPLGEILVRRAPMPQDAVEEVRG